MGRSLCLHLTFLQTNAWLWCPYRAHLHRPVLPKHLPGFKEQADALRAKGIDAIACVSVNDVFVMAAWGEDQKVGSDVMMLADGNATFSDAIGLSFDGSGFGMGKRAQRYSMIVNDGVVEQLNVETPGEFKVSSADYMLGQL